MSIGLRIKELRKRNNLTQSDFASKIDVKQSPLSQMESGTILPSLETVSKIIREFNISYNWLIDGEDEKTKNKEILIKNIDKENDKENDNKRNVKKTLSIENDLSIVAESRPEYENPKLSLFNDVAFGVPLIPIDAIAGFGSGSTQVMDYDTQLYVVPEFTELKVDFMIRVKGSSMYPKYNSGDLVACKKLNIRDIFFQWNKVYVLDTEQGALIKRIKKATDGDHILLVSDNNSYDPFPIHLSKVYAVALVVGVIRLE